jgi:hypothetical protein
MLLLFVNCASLGDRVSLGRLVTGILGSNTARGMDVCVSVLCCPV